MLRNLLLSLLVYTLITAADELYRVEGQDGPTVHRNRMFKFAIYQDLLVALSILKMMVVEGYSISAVVERIRSSGLVTHVYVATSVALHGTLLLDERAPAAVRLTPAPYVPPALPEDQKELFMV